MKKKKYTLLTTSRWAVKKENHSSSLAAHDVIERIVTMPYESFDHALPGSGEY